MVNLTGKSRAVVTTLVTCWVTSGAIAAERSGADEDQAPAGARWQLLEPAPDGSIELVARDRAGAVAAVCNDGECGVFVEPIAGCVPGSRYPLLINSAKQVGVIASTCGVLTSNGASRYVVRLERQNALFPAMLRGDDISIAFPTQGGSMNVIHVNMEGVRDHLAKLLPLTGNGPAEEPGADRPDGPDESRAQAAPVAPADEARADAAEPGAGDAPEEVPRSSEPRRFVVPDRNRFGGAMTTT